MGQSVQIVHTGLGGYLALPDKKSGPALIVLQEIFGVNANIRDICDTYAEEGYVAFAPDLFWRQERDVQIDPSASDAMEKALPFLAKFSDDEAIEDVRTSIRYLKEEFACTDPVGAVGYCLGGRIAIRALLETEVMAAASYYGVAIEKLFDRVLPAGKKALLHIAALDHYCAPDAQVAIRKAAEAEPGITAHFYANCDHAFARKGSIHYHEMHARLADDRSVCFLKSSIGPIYDLEALWERHLDYEFHTRDADKTMSTMVSSPYVNHIPTMTGGVGYADLHRFYRDYFIGANPADTEQISVSRTIGVNQIVDEVIFSFTHDKVMEWLLPGVAPTGKHVRFGLVGIVKFRGDKLCHEHIYWDQASVLAQIGMLDAGTLPIVGRQAADKITDNSIPSNHLITDWRA